MDTLTTYFTTIERLIPQMVLGLVILFACFGIGGCAPAPTPAPTLVPPTIVPSPTLPPTPNPIPEVKPNFDSYCRARYDLPNAYAQVLTVYTSEGAGSEWFCVVNPQDYITGKRPINMFDVCAHDYSDTPRPLLKNQSDPNSWVCTTNIQAAAISPANTPIAIATSVSAPTVAFTSFPTQTSLPSTSLPPGLFVTTMRIQPDQPAHNTNIAFFVTFLNTADTIQNFKWRVYIYRADTPTASTADTSFLQTAFPPGTNEFQSLGTFRFGPQNPCDYFFARVGWVTSENKIVFFNQPDGQMYAKGFSVCN